MWQYRGHDIVVPLFDLVDEVSEPRFLHRRANFGEASQILERIHIPISNLENWCLGGEAVGKVLELSDTMGQPHRELLLKEGSRE